MKHDIFTECIASIAMALLVFSVSCGNENSGPGDVPVPGVYSINPDGFAVSSAAAVKSITLTREDGEADSWELSSSAAWLKFSASPSGSGSNTLSGKGLSSTVYLVIGANTGAASRTAVVSVNGTEACTVIQYDVSVIFTGQEDFSDALSSALGAGGTIVLTGNIIWNEPIVISGITLTLNLQGYTFSLETENEGMNSLWSALCVKSGGKLLLEGSGAFNVNGYYRGVTVDGEGSEAAVTSARTSGYEFTPPNYGAGATNHGSVTISADAEGYVNGAYAHGSGVVIVGGNAEADNCGANADGAGSAIEIGGNALSTGDTLYSDGARAVNGGTITVAGDAVGLGINSRGASASGTDSAVMIGGNASGTLSGVEALFSSSIAVEGDSIASSGTGAFAGIYSSVTVGGNAIASISGIGAFARDSSTLTVADDAIGSGMNSYGAYADGAGTRVEVGGSASAIDSSNGTGAYSGSNAVVTVGGDASSDKYGARTALGSITLHGSAAASGIQGYGVSAEGGSITVGSSVYGYCGVHAANSGIAAIEGGITGTTYYIWLGPTANFKTIDNGVPIVEGVYAGYLEFTDGENTVYVRIP